MISLVRRHSLVVNGRKTIVRLEDAFWEGLKEIASAHRTSVENLISLIEAHHADTNLSSAIRLTVLEFYRDGTLFSLVQRH